jgi:HEAT repeat protein
MIQRRVLVTAAACVLGAALLAGHGCNASRRPGDQWKSAADAATALAALEVAGPNVQGACETLADLLDAESPVLRWQAAAVLGGWAAAGAPDIVRPALEHADPLVRSLALDAYLANSPSGRGPILVGGKVYETERPLLVALAELYDPKGYTAPAILLPDQAARLRDDLHGDAATAVLAADLLARIGDAGARRVLTELSSTSDGPVLAKIAQASIRDRMGLGPIVLPQAFQGDAAARLGVVRTLVSRPDPRLKDLLVTAMTEDADAAVRRNAIRALGNLGAAAPVDALAEALSHAPAEEKHDIVQALGAAGGPAVAALRRYVAEGKPDAALQVTALRAMGPHATRDDIAWIAASLQSPDAPVRAAAAGALGQVAHPAAQESLMLAAGDPEPIVRANVAGALGCIGTVYGCEYLLKALEDPDALVASMAAWGLGEAKYVDGVAALAKVASNADAPMRASRRLADIAGSPRLAAIGALGKIGTEDAKSVLLIALEDKDPVVRMAAAQALGADGQATPEIQAALEKHLADPSDLVRAAALLSLEATGKTYPPGFFQGKS